MLRRDFLQLLAAAAPLAMLPGAALATPGQRERVLVLVQLDGGNDGLNTVIPYADPAYRRLRPSLGLPRDQVLQLGERAGLHPGLEALMPLWERRQLGIVQGLGYAAPNRSHFRSTDIWETGSASDEVLTEGWVARALGGEAADRELCADAIALDGQELGPLQGGALRSLVMSDPERFIRDARRVPTAAAASSNPALRHLLTVQRDLQASAAKLEARLDKARTLEDALPKTPLGRQLQSAARLIAAGSTARVFKVVHGGFDTHANQLGRHGVLLGQLGEALAAFAQVMTRLGRWEDVLVATYSEFGRRPGENASGGTDHGTAAPHLVMGGRVKGGLYGAAPSLVDLEEGELRYTTELSAYYGTIMRGWWDVGGGGKGLGFL